MEDLQKCVDFYLGKDIWVYPNNGYKFSWSMWKGKYPSTYKNKELPNYSWDKEKGIRAVVGINHLAVIKLKKTNTITSEDKDKVLQKTLEILGLPNNYSWIICTKEQKDLFILVKIFDDKNAGNDKIGFGHFDYIKRGFLNMPSPGAAMQFYYGREPTYEIKRIGGEDFPKVFGRLKTALYKFYAGIYKNSEPTVIVEHKKISKWLWGACSVIVTIGIITAIIKCSK